MRPVREGLGFLGILVAYLVLFGAGAAAFGPGVDPASLTPSEQAASTWLLAVMALLDLLLLRAWLVRSRDRGLRAWLSAFVVLYGCKTFSSLLEVWAFVQESHVPAAMLPGLFAMTLPMAVGVSGLAAWAWAPKPAEPPAPDGRGPGALALRVGLAGAVLYPVLFFAFGWGVAWQSAALRAYYGGPAVPLPVVEHFARMFGAQPWLLPFEMGRGLLWVAIGWPVLKRTKGPWWVGGLLFGALLAVLQNDAHLLPNPLMPREVRLVHLLETVPSDFLFGLGAAALLAPPGGLRALLAARPAPIPEGQRGIAAVAAALLGLLGLSGLAGGAALVADPSGGLLALDPALLSGTPFPDYDVPGVVLFLANGVLPLGALVAIGLGDRRAPTWVLGAGVVLVGWMTAQLGWLGFQMWIQGLLLGWGVVLLAVGGLWRARAGS